MPKKKVKEPRSYKHSEEHPQRPDVGTERQFKKKKPPVKYRYDSSLSPELNWDESPAREEAESLIAEILEAESLEEAQAAATKLKAMTEPFLNWTGKAEHQEFEVPTLPLFVHERLSTRAIIETLKSHKAGGNQLELFNDPQWSITDQILKAYEYYDKWVNRMILGDSLTVMNSLLQYEGMGGKVQMIYMDPPYGVNFGSNFQPFVKKRDVKHNDDEHLTREPEMVQAYRDTWELGLHSYLTYMRDRLLLVRELLTESGSVFVQISDENVHHVRELMDEVFGGDNFVTQINYQTMTPLESGKLESVFDYILWYAKSKKNMKYQNLYIQKPLAGNNEFKFVETSVGEYRGLNSDELLSIENFEDKNKVFKRSVLESSGYTKSCTFPFCFNDKTFIPRGGKSWRTNEKGMNTLKEKGRLFVLGTKLYYKLFYSDFSYVSLLNNWSDTVAGYSEAKLYVVQTNPKAIQRCLLMTTDPSDLVLDTTCGSGTTAYVAERWGRRWITCDVSRVPLALARQRLLTATFPWYQLRDGNSPAGGFVYQRKQNRKGEEIGGIVPHISLEDIANQKAPKEEILVDRPEEDKSIVRVCSPFTVEGTIPPPVDMEDQDEPESEATVIDNDASHEERMLEVLKKSPVLRLPENRTIALSNVRQPARASILSAEAMVKASELKGVTLTDVVDETIEENNSQLPLSQKAVAFVFGPENGAITERTVYEASKEAQGKKYAHLFVIGFAIAANARQFVEHCHETMEIPATYIQATPDLLMGDLLKHMKSSQIFSVCGLPEIKLHKTEDEQYQVELLGLDVFDPSTMEVDSEPGNNVPAWFLDTDYNGLCFYVRQAFFPRTKAWDSIKKALKGSYDEEVWEHLAGTISAPFNPGEHNEVAVKVIDDRGNELLVTKSL